MRSPTPNVSIPNTFHGQNCPSKLASLYDYRTIVIPSSLSPRTDHLPAEEAQIIEGLQEFLPNLGDISDIRNHYDISNPKNFFQTEGSYVYFFFNSHDFLPHRRRDVQRVMESSFDHHFSRYSQYGNTIYSLKLSFKDSIFPRSSKDQIRFFSLLHALPHLEFLYLDYIPVSSFEWLPPFLKFLHLSHHKCQDLTGLEHLSQLEQLIIDSGPLRNLLGCPSPLPHLKELTIRNNPLRIFFPSPFFPALKHLEILNHKFPNLDYQLQVENKLCSTNSRSILFDISSYPRPYISPHCVSRPILFDNILMGIHQAYLKMPPSYLPFLRDARTNLSLLHTVFDPTPLNLTYQYCEGCSLSPVSLDRIVFEGDFDCFRALLHHQGSTDPLTQALATELSIPLRFRHFFL